MPEAPQAYRTFAIHSADIGKTGHNYRKDESWETTLNLIKVYEKGNAEVTREALLATEMTEEALRAFKAHKSGTLKLRPFIGETRTAIAAKLLSDAGVNLDTLRNSCVELITNAPQVVDHPVQIDGNVVSIKPMIMFGL